MITHIGGRTYEVTTRKKQCKDGEHDFIPTFQGGDTYKCSRCGKEIDMTEDEE